MWTEVLLVIGFAWLLVLTLLFAGLAQHAGAVQATGSAAKAPEGGFLLDTDGPWIPSECPARTRQILQTNGIGLADLTITFFSSTCGPCLERATQIATTSPDPACNVFLVTGSNATTVGEMRRILVPVGAPVLYDPDAHDLVKSLEINSTPFAIRLVDGKIVGKGYIRELADYQNVSAIPADDYVLVQSDRDNPRNAPATQLPESGGIS